MLAFLLSTVLLAMDSHAQGVSNDLKTCGSQQYNETDYTCYDGLLCPITFNYPQARCGDGCYSPLYFNCIEDKLVALPSLTKPFKLLAYSPNQIVAGSIEACGGGFHIQEGGPCSYCPPQVGNSCPPGKETVLLPGVGLDTLVPGGQRYYVNHYDGHLGFTTAHSAQAVNASFGYLAALDGGAFYFGGPFAFDGTMGGFVTCPSQGYKIYAKWSEPDAPSPTPDCFEFYILTVPWNGTGAAAWEYT